MSAAVFSNAALPSFGSGDTAHRSHHESAAEEGARLREQLISKVANTAQTLWNVGTDRSEYTRRVLTDVLHGTHSAIFRPEDNKAKESLWQSLHELKSVDPTASTAAERHVAELIQLGGPLRALDQATCGLVSEGFAEALSALTQRRTLDRSRMRLESADASSMRSQPSGFRQLDDAYGSEPEDIVYEQMSDGTWTEVSGSGKGPVSRSRQDQRGGLSLMPISGGMSNTSSPDFGDLRRKYLTRFPRRTAVLCDEIGNVLGTVALNEALKMSRPPPSIQINSAFRPPSTVGYEMSRHVPQRQMALSRMQLEARDGFDFESWLSEGLGPNRHPLASALISNFAHFNLDKSAAVRTESYGMTPEGIQSRTRSVTDGNHHGTAKQWSSPDGAVAGSSFTYADRTGAKGYCISQTIGPSGLRGANLRLSNKGDGRSFLASALSGAPSAVQSRFAPSRRMLSVV